MTNQATATGPAAAGDEWLFGWDPTPGIVSVWAERSGRAVVWRRDPAGGVCASAERFRPWLFAASLAELARDRDALQRRD